MINSLSILIPTYNNVCLELVRDLQAQASILSSTNDFEYEILVADDGSTDKNTIEKNCEINELDNCRYIERKENIGRAAIRNFLAKEAKYLWLLFLDSDLKLDNSDFIRNYMLSKGNVIVGGLKIGGNPITLKDNLRYKYEKKCEKQHWKSVVANQKTTQIWNLDYYLFIKVSDNFTKKCTVWVKVRLCTSRNWKSTNVYLKTTRNFMMAT